MRCENSGPQEGHRRRRDGWKIVLQSRKPPAEGCQTRDRVGGDLDQANAGKLDGVIPGNRCSNG